LFINSVGKILKKNWPVIVLLAGTLALYWPVSGFDLVYYDDPKYLQDCPQIKSGLSWAGVSWAFGHAYFANWIPVTHLSYLLVSQCFGLAPGPQHLVNAAVHAVNAALLFLLLRRLTQAVWRSALVAALFAWHPLRVESVAWISERKDVLCLFFSLLALLAYVRYAQTRNQKPVVSSAGSKLSVRQPRFASPFSAYAWSLVFFALGLMSKPMAVVLPVLFLLLDYWPLRRLDPGEMMGQTGRRLLGEKVPFFAASLAAGVITYLAQQSAGSVVDWQTLGPEARLANAIASYAGYVGQLFWPLDLIPIYPYPQVIEVWPTGLKLALLLVISIGCWRQRWQRPYLAFGWFWYLLAALPTIGLLQAGEQAHADRYTYLPHIGLLVAVVWGGWELISRGRWARRVGVFFSVSAMLCLAVLTGKQLGYWRDTITLFRHAVDVTPDSSSSLFTLGVGYEKIGDTNRALDYYGLAHKISPNEAETQHNLAGLLRKSGNLSAAKREYEDLVQRHPEDVTGKINLANIYGSEGQPAVAVSWLMSAVRQNPKSLEGLNNLAWLLATCPDPGVRDGNEAVRLAQKACELTRREQTIYVGTLAAAYAEVGDFDQAIATAQSACALADKNGETNLLARNQQLLEQYRRHQPVRE
jgi:protein O-mannosyl-transferase